MIYHLDKPVGVLSADWIRWHQHKEQAHKAGHGGALDVMASGDLVMATDRDTKQLTTFLQNQKKYRCTMILGASTDTADLEASTITIDSSFLQSIPSDLESRLTKAFAQWEGQHEQYVPLFSSAKVQGYTLREIARFGTVRKVENGIVSATYRNKELTLELPSKTITVSQIKMLEYAVHSTSHLQEMLGTIEQQVTKNILDLDKEWLQGRKSRVYEEIQDSVKNTIVQINDGIKEYEQVPVVTWEATVSGGTYIRQLALDVAAICGTKAVCIQIHRLTIPT